ncbi:LAMI_0E07492g1_1 [Lachancea mirantina]|uniref:GDT1 family protein n=1 Tax=Lachancea mirantina TaxID=1230905 RepID=A0A1G4JN15_9SACH|nr:LAMI_0E07492g1_1 [Lachancea mirantina]
MPKFQSTALLLLGFSAVVFASAGSDSSVGNNEVDPDVAANDPKTAFLFAISMIIVSEIGDKTFLIAALMAMRYSHLLVFSASASSLFIMTILSGLVGRTFTTLVPVSYTKFMAGILFLVFGYKLTMEGLSMSKDVGVEEELAEVEEEIAVTDINKEMDNAEQGSDNAVSSKPTYSNNKLLNNFIIRTKNLFSYILSPVWVNIFSMVFFGEFGDRSQISTIAMASGSHYWSVIFGAVIGHAICTGIAVIGGKLLAAKISMRTVTLGGAFSFIVFAFVYIVGAFNEA